MAKKSKKVKKATKPKKIKKAIKVKKARKAHKAHKASKPKTSQPVKRAKRALSKMTSYKPVLQMVTSKEAKTSIAPVRVKEEPPLTDSQIQKFRDFLSQKREELFNVVQRKKEQEIQLDEGEIGDEADIATRSVEKEMLFELTDSEKQTLDMIEAALRKIEKGVYGQCESCRRNISRGRMEVMPWARNCIRCQTENEFPAPEPFPQ